MKRLTPDSSPALSAQSDSYPFRFLGRVPRRVRALKRVQPDPGYELLVGADTIASLTLAAGEACDVWVSSSGAVVACLPNGLSIGIKPDEFQVIAWHTNAADRVVADASAVIEAHIAARAPPSPNPQSARHSP